MANDRTVVVPLALEDPLGSEEIHPGFSRDHTPSFFVAPGLLLIHSFLPLVKVRLAFGFCEGERFVENTDIAMECIVLGRIVEGGMTELEVWEISDHNASHE
jgi:hypothetical protein